MAEDLEFLKTCLKQGLGQISVVKRLGHLRICLLVARG